MNYLIISRNSGVLDQAFLLAREGHRVVLASSTADQQFAEKYNVRVESSVFAEENHSFQEMIAYERPQKLTEHYKKSVSETCEKLVTYAKNNNIERIVSDSLHHGLCGLAELCTKANIPYIGPDSVFAETEINRFALRETMKEQGIRVPDLYYQGEADLVDAKSIKMPCVVKAKQQFFIKARVCDDIHELKELLVDYGSTPIYIEEKVSGKEFISAYWTTPEKKGRMYAMSITVDTKAQAGVGATSATADTESFYDEVKAREYIFPETTGSSAIGHGFMNFIVDESGHAYFLENNARPPIYETYVWLDSVHDHYSQLIEGKLEFDSVTLQNKEDWYFFTSLIVYQGNSDGYVPVELTIPENGFWFTRNQYATIKNGVQKDWLLDPAILTIGSSTSEGLAAKIEKAKQIFTDETPFLVQG